MSLHTFSSYPSASAAPPLSATKAEAHSLRQQLLLLMFLGDIIFAYLGLGLAYWARFESPLSVIGVSTSGQRSFSAYQPVLILGVIFLAVGFLQQKIYSWKLILRPRKLIPLTLRAVTFWFVAYLCTSVVFKFEPQISRIFMVYGWVAVMITVALWKYAFIYLLRITGQTRQLAQRVVFVGWTKESIELADAIHGDVCQPYQVVGWFRSCNNGRDKEPPDQHPTLGDLDSIEHTLAAIKPDILVVTDPDLGRASLTRIAKACEINYVQLKIQPSIFQIFVSGLHLETISGRPLLGIEEMPVQRLTAQMIKRTVDIVGALVGLALSAPAIAVLAWLIKREDPSGPAFYRQTRSGLHGKPFTIYKLRSMRVDAETNGAQWAQKNDPRRLRIGKFMRESNLDEVPQFWNVLKGDMSLVGPRPERPELIQTFEREIEHYNHRHQVKPGITGWAQIHGLRGDTDLSERIRYDCYYIENWSILMDFQCLLMTFIKRDNAY